MGVTAILHHTPAPLTASAHGMSYVPWTGGQVHGNDAEEWPDPEYGKSYAQHMLNSRGSGVLAYSLGDEGRVAGIRDGPKTDAAFRAYLKETYGDIAALNRAWDSTFATFDDIQVKPVKAASAPPAAKVAGAPQNHARAYDLAYPAGHNFVKMAKQMREWVRKDCDDPHAGIGFEGSGHIANIPCDPELICRGLDMWAPYTGITEEFIRSVAPRPFVRSSRIGYSSDAENLTGWYWRQIMNGTDSVRRPGRLCARGEVVTNQDVCPTATPFLMSYTHGNGAYGRELERALRCGETGLSSLSKAIIPRRISVSVWRKKPTIWYSPLRHRCTFTLPKKRPFQSQCWLNVNARSTPAVSNRFRKNQDSSSGITSSGAVPASPRVSPRTRKLESGTKFSRMARPLPALLTMQAGASPALPRAAPAVSFTVGSTSTWRSCAGAGRTRATLASASWPSIFRPASSSAL